LATGSVQQSVLHYITADGARIEFTSTCVKLYKRFSKPPKNSSEILMVDVHSFLTYITQRRIFHVVVP
jgi:hypothetical protein